MQFSIRVLLALTLLAALGLLIWRTNADVQRNRQRAAQLEENLADLDAMAALLRSERDYEQVHELAKRASEHFAGLRQKYSSLTPRAPDVLSIRRVPPAPRRESVTSDFSFVFVAPKERPVWIKYGIRRSRQFASVSRLERAEMLTSTFFDLSGPYEKKLAPGFHKIEFTRASDPNRGTLVTIKLDGKPLLLTTHPPTSHTMFEAGAGKSQTDIRPTAPCPKLISMSTGGFVLSLWLHDKPSSFKGFPGNTAPQTDKAPVTAP